MKALKMLVFLAFLAVHSYGQELTGTVRGVLTDQDGLVIAQGSVDVSGVVKMNILTGFEGEYVLILPPGEYNLIFAKDGFSALQKNVSVRAGGNVVLNITLEVAGVSESITVEESSPEIDTGSSTLSTTIKSDDQIKLPLNSGFLGGLIVTPGVRSEPVGGGTMSDGSSRAENNYYVGGVNMSDAETGSIRVMNNIPAEFVEETQIQRSSDARFGGSLGAVVNGILRKGQNEIHGQVWTYANYYLLDAPPRPVLRFSPLDDNEVEYFSLKKDKYRAFSPGFAVGGPIIKDKVFFFSGSRPSLGITERSVTLTRNNLPGNFSSHSRQDFTVNKVDTDLLYRGRPLQISVSHIYNPWRVRGFLPGQDGSGSPETLWHERGFRAPSSLVLWRATYFPTDKWILSAYGGRNYTNFKDTYGLAKGPSIAYLVSSIGLDGVPRKFQAQSGDFTPNNLQTQKDKFRRNNIYLDTSYLTQFRGSHLISFGYQSDNIQNDAFANTWPDGRFLVVWDRVWQGIKGGSLRGKYGFYIEDQFETSGQVKSKSHAFYFQDNWQVRKNLMLNLGVRTESETVPSFLANNNPDFLSFSFSEKIAPRFGIVYDPSGTGKTKLSLGVAVVYDVIKYNLSRGASGGDKWLRCIYPLNDPDVFKLRQGDSKKAFECLNLRVPANEAVDPTIKPMQQRMVSVGYERDLGNGLILSVYGINKSLVRTIEDVGRLVVNNGIVEEQYCICNPGEGTSINPSWFPPGIPSPITPRAKRDYRALEVRMDKRTSSYFATGSYTLSRLWGNYSGLASSDERGRINPNTNRDNDQPHTSRDRNAKLVYGNLATDRPHAFKFFGYKILSSFLGQTSFGTSFIWQSGTPLSTQVPILTGAPAFAYGRGDMGRTPSFSETGFTYGYEFKLPEFKDNQKVRLEWTVANVFNQNTALDRVTSLLHPNDNTLNFSSTASIFKGYDPIALAEKQGIRLNPAYGMDSAFQAPRSMRVAVRFLF